MANRLKSVGAIDSLTKGVMVMVMLIIVDIVVVVVLSACIGGRVVEDGDNRSKI